MSVEESVLSDMCPEGVGENEGETFACGHILYSIAKFKRVLK